MSKSDLEAMFLNLWRLLASDMPKPSYEWRFAAYKVGIGGGIRKRLRDAGLKDWRFDYCWPEQRVAVELEGGVHSKGRHVRGKGYEGDCEKYNFAQSEGWSVYRFTRGMMERDPAGCIDQVVAALSGDERLPFMDIEIEKEE